MTPFIKGAEDVFDALGVESPGVVTDLKKKIVDEIPAPIKSIREQIGQSYRATPVSLLFGRYRNTLGGLVKSVKEKADNLFD